MRILGAALAALSLIAVVGSARAADVEDVAAKMLTIETRHSWDNTIAIGQAAGYRVVCNGLFGDVAELLSYPGISLQLIEAGTFDVNLPHASTLASMRMTSAAECDRVREHLSRASPFNKIKITVDDATHFSLQSVR